MPLFDKKDKSRYATFTRRTFGVTGVMGAVFTVLAGRLYQLQIVHGDTYMTEAEDNRVSQRLVAPLRGRILDRFGTELASNRRNYRVMIVPEQAVEGVDTALTSIARVITLTDHQREKALRDIAENKKFIPVPVAENLTWEEFARINLHLPYLPGVLPDAGETRAYPYGDLFSHILGYVAPVSPEDMEADSDPLLSLPGFRIGKRGVEKEYDSEVRGSAGVSRVEVNAYGRVIRELGNEEGVPGKDVYLTIDQQLQQFAAQRLGSESAAAVVLDVSNGDVLSLVSTPGYDPNAFNVGVTPNVWQQLTTDDHKPLLNKAIAGVYPPGSTFKPLMALAAYDNGLKDLHVNCTGVTRLGNYEFHCWKRGGHGGVDLHRGIQVSCDCFFYEVARRLGIDKLEQSARAMGLGAATGIELPGERGGFIPSRAWKEATYHVPWLQGETLSAGIGQGYVTATPLQLATYVARVASGKAVKPRLVHDVGAARQPQSTPENLPFTDEAFSAVHSGMSAVTNDPGGTAFRWRISEPGMEMAGKTGTAQVRVITRSERASGVRKDTSLPWKLRDHGLFIAFAPVVAPRYACAVVVEHGALGHPQVQMAHDILLFAQQRDPLKLPTGYPVDAASAGGGMRG
ncbi:MAG TPA: penicillin-binding protein 2 [Rhizomicrobium sp.]|jgi:penicillin-binding protein 2